MSYLVGGVCGFMLGTVVMAVLGRIVADSAYSNGFCDGVQWSRDPTWPSRPGKKWWGWKDIEEGK